MKKIIGCLLAVILMTGLHAQNLVYDANAQVRKVSSFHGVAVGSGIVVYLSQGKQQAVAVSAGDDNDVEKIITEVKNGILKIRIESKFWGNWGNKKLKAYVTVTELDYLDASGGSIAKITDEISVNDLKSDASGGSIIEGRFKGNKLDAGLSGGSIYKLQGSFNSLTIDASGGSIFNDFSLATNNCSVEASGGSIINVSVNKELKADASGGSIINYKGTGVITSVDASGGSSIKKKD
ncbi:MAG: head GIN domain-containing protein [Panacibacter sp.]